MNPAAVYELWQRELAKPRNRDPRRLTFHGAKVFSQNDEDGIIAEIFNRIGTTNREFIEFGVELGIECNSTWLLMNQWTGTWMEANTQSCESIRNTHRHFIEQGKLSIINIHVDTMNIDSLIAGSSKYAEPDFLSIDVDYNDYWIWEAIYSIKPRVVSIEYNASWAPPASIAVPYDATKQWDGTNYFGASLSALNLLAGRKGYSLVGCCLAGVNAFFVRNDLVKDQFLKPGSVSEHYEPPRYFFSGIPVGHRAAVGPVVTVS